MKAQVGVFLVACCMFISCGGPSRTIIENYDEVRNRTSYRAEGISIPIESGSGYGSRFRHVRMRLMADCVGEHCRPEEVRLVLLSTGGGTDIYLGNRTLVLAADNEEFTWQDPVNRENSRPERIAGMIILVRVSIDRLQKIANAESVSGRVGAIDLELGRNMQTRMQAFLTQMGYGEDPA